MARSDPCLVLLVWPALSGAAVAAGGRTRAEVFVSDPTTIDPAARADLTSRRSPHRCFDALLELDEDAGAPGPDRWPGAGACPPHHRELYVHPPHGARNSKTGSRDVRAADVK